MKIVLALLMCFLLLHAEVYAFHGGLVDNKAFGGGDPAGTFVGAIRGSNLIGVTIFGISGNQESDGRYAVFREGVSFRGRATAIVDTNERRIIGNFLGSRAITLTAITSTVIILINGTPTPFTFTDSNSVIINADGGFNGKLSSQAPIFAYTAEGIFSFFTELTPPPQNAPVTSDVKFKMDGMRTSTALPILFSTPLNETGG